MHSFCLNTLLKTNSNKENNMFTKLHKFSTLKAEWRAEGSSESVVFHASLIMHIFDNQKLVSTDAILCPIIFWAQEEGAVHGWPTIFQVPGTMS